MSLPYLRCMWFAWVASSEWAEAIRVLFSVELKKERKFNNENQSDETSH